jgi:hypothetical protein
MPVPPQEPGFGVPCPDAGYGFLLGHQFDPRLVVDPAENREDARWAAATLGVRRAGRAGRAPQAEDIEVGQALLGYDGTAPEWFVAWRTTRLQGISRDADLSQWLADTAEEGVGITDVPPREELLRWWPSSRRGRYRRLCTSDHRTPTTRSRDVRGGAPGAES